MKTSRKLAQKTSPLMAAAAGAAVCISGIGAHALTGNIASSNAGNTSFGGGDVVNVFGALANFRIQTYGSSYGYVNGSTGGMSFMRSVGTTCSACVYRGPVGVLIDGAQPFGDRLFNGPAYADKYIGVRFDDSGTRYGWIHAVSSTNGVIFKVDTWGYDQTGGVISTLDESISPKAMPLSDGRVKLHWSNANEDGVARYEVQAKGADGAWAAVDSNTPGAGSYAATVKADASYRLMVESIDGSSRTLDF